MPLDSVIALNQTQKIPELSIINRTVVQPTTHYTCPTGKKAKVKAWVRCTGTGAAATTTFEVNGVSLLKWRNHTIGSSSYGSTPENALLGGSNTSFMMTGTAGKVEFVLQAGETIVTDQDSGTNAEFDINLEILELPA